MDAVINLDMVGMGAFAVVFRGPQEPVILGSLSANAEAAGIKVVGDNANPASDQKVFVSANVPAVMILTAGEHLYYHTPGDDPETLNSSLLEDVAQLVFLSVCDLAEA